MLYFLKFDNQCIQLLWVEKENIVYFYNIMLHLLKFDKQYIYYYYSNSIFLINIFVAKCDKKCHIYYNNLSILQNYYNFVAKGIFFIAKFIAFQKKKMKQLSNVFR